MKCEKSKDVKSKYTGSFVGWRFVIEIMIMEDYIHIIYVIGTTGSVDQILNWKKIRDVVRESQVGKSL